MKRGGGILLHPTSLPNQNNQIGTLGHQAYQFVEWLDRAGMKYWQILPLNPTGKGNCPYASFSAFAAEPLLIDLDFIREKNWLTSQEADFPISDLKKVDFDKVRNHHSKVMPVAYDRFLAIGGHEVEQFYLFCEQQKDWLDDFALFMAIKDHFRGEPWFEWDKAIKFREEKALNQYKKRCTDQISYHKFLQYLALSQWKGVKDYANSKGIQVIGDIPIYVSMDSVDVWMNPGLFDLDEKLNPINVAGVPPDYFSEDGQLWGNPVFNWQNHIDTDFEWWLNRVKNTLQWVDLIRLDHFRAFESYWSVKSGEQTAKNGSWVKAEGRLLFETFKEAFGDLPFIAEDLGVITPEVEALRDDFCMSGMKILQFAFDSGEGNDFRPYNYVSNSVVYTGTHDNDTLMGWIENASQEDKKLASLYFNTTELMPVDFIRSAWSSVSCLAITTMQDVLEEGSSSRMNIPGTPDDNWEWRFDWTEVRGQDKILRLFSDTFGR